MRSIKANLPLKLEGSQNTRDLGGYPTVVDGNTANAQFVRSDNPSKFTAADRKLLYDYGVRLVIDFRSESETEKEPCALKGYGDIEYTNPQMIDNIHVQPETHEEAEATKSAVVAGTLGEMYIDFMENKKHVYLKVFHDVLRHLEDCIFFNCTAGKDRAGTFAMILLKLAGVPDEVVVADYAISGELIREEMNRLLAMYKAQGVELDEDMIRSRPEHMLLALEHLNSKYGSIETWMGTVGLSAEEIAKIKNKLLGKY
ncbi:MAG: tyrosine-protein phosphatase [Symbiobacteriaceae bacterium]|nr:tyrosine-protein phosphatase [Symbiobacteriaceae bacterium]